MHLFGIKKDVDLFINITLNLQISLGETDAFVMLRSYIKSKWFFLHVKVQFWTFSSNLKFNYIDLHIFPKFTPKFSSVLFPITDVVFSLIISSNPYVNAIDICILIIYCATLVIVFIIWIQISKNITII